MYSFARNESYSTARLEALTDDYFEGRLTRKLSNLFLRNTMADWFGFCREVVFNKYDAIVRHSGKIGGPGIVVQIDETKVGNRKYNRGKRVHGHWLIAS
ncbi:hypothetical protein M3Y95_00775400 [Aphelenchoides besseyi]|nr:hypothetical protein M3Y95_00775400 [Aphelenchoides besseyi]